MYQNQIKVKHQSNFRDVSASKIWFECWVNQLEKANARTYEKLEVWTSLGKTIVYGFNLKANIQETLVIFPGARTSALFWDMNNNLNILRKDVRVFMVETNGLPNLSDGNSPDVHDLDYGWWASEVLDQLGISETFIAGASFGGLICAKLCLVSPKKVKASFLLNPGFLQPFSLNLKNLFYNLLPILAPSKKSIESFLDNAIFHKPCHKVKPVYERLIIDYEYYALTQYNDHTMKPYYMEDELHHIKTDTYLILGDKDILFPYKESIENAYRMPGIKDLVVLSNVGHGIETFEGAFKIIKGVINKELRESKYCQFV